MADHSKIEWTDASWNPIRARDRATGRVGWHCEHMSPGCANCYSEGFNARLGTQLPFKPGHRADVEVFLNPTMLLQPLRWRRPRMIFVCSMTDLFADFVPDAFIDQVFAVMALCPQHTFQVLTKRSARMRAYLSAARAHPVGMAAFSIVLEEAVRDPKSNVGAGIMMKGDIPHLSAWPLPNVWVGVSAEDQRRADERVPDLLATLAAVRFVSAEPLLGPIDFTAICCPNGCTPPEYCNRCHPDGGRQTGSFNAFGGGTLDWVIVGGESGRGARPMHPDWARALHDQCAAESVPFFFKQWGEYGPCELQSPGGPAPTSVVTSDGEHLTGANAVTGRLDDSDAEIIARFGKKLAGRLLDGVEHNSMPQVAAAPLAGVA